MEHYRLRHGSVTARAVGDPDLLDAATDIESVLYLKSLTFVDSEPFYASPACPGCVLACIGMAGSPLGAVHGRSKEETNVIVVDAAGLEP
jgi:hypothetical protein